MNPTLSDTLSQRTPALWKVQASSQDNLAAVAGNTAPPADIYVPPVITPLGQKAEIGATVKSTPVVLTKTKTEEIQMEINEHTPSTSSGKPLVPKPRLAKAKHLKSTNLADEVGIRQWTYDMLGGHPGCRASEFEQWGNSYAIQLKEVLNAMTQSLRIK